MAGRTDNADARPGAAPREPVAEESPAVDAGLLGVVTEAARTTRRRAAGEFDGLLGTLPRDAAGLLHQLLRIARDALIEDLGSEEAAREAVTAHASPGGWHGGDRRTRLALEFLCAFQSAALVADSTECPEMLAEVASAGLDRETLVFGRAGRARKAAQRAGGR